MAAQSSWRLLLAAAAAIATTFPSVLPAEAAVNYVRICDSLGPAWYLDPGTDTCINADSGETQNIDGGDKGLTHVTGQAYEGIAISLATPNATVDPGKTFGVNVNVGTYEGTAAIGVGAAISSGTGFTFNTSFGVGLKYGTAAGHIGISQSW